jgi:hypothetical protein
MHRARRLDGANFRHRRARAPITRADATGRSIREHEAHLGTAATATSARGKKVVSAPEHASRYVHTSQIPAITRVVNNKLASGGTITRQDLRPTCVADHPERHAVWRALLRRDRLTPQVGNARVAQEIDNEHAAAAGGRANRVHERRHRVRAGNIRTGESAAPRDLGAQRAQRHAPTARQAD